jgi:type II secretory pathway predicted ATPase ExeA
MSYLGYGLAQGEGFVVITGEVGSGKSTLVQHLLESIDRARLNTISLVSTQVEGDDMLRLAVQGMGIATTGLAKAQLLERAEQWLEDQARLRKRTLLIVDEAQTLSISALEELRMLSNFQIAGQALIQILLLGQPEFRDKLASEPLEQLRQRVIATHHLEPMERGELQPYIQHRLAMVGWQGRPLLDEAAFDALYRHSAGIPRRVNQLANRVLLFGAVERLDSIGAEAVDTVAADMAADAVLPKGERVLPLRSGVAAAQGEAAPVADHVLVNRIATLEARLQEQDMALRRVLGLMVEWVEGGVPAQSVRHNAA